MLKQFLPAELDLIQSRGSIARKAGSLAGLHEKREETLSQFFTPAWLVKFIWQAISPAFQDETFHYSLFDNSIGAASMFRFADPAKFHLYGLDADGDLVSTLVNVLDKSPYRFDVVQASMEQVELEKFSAALINPPFSIPLSSPFLKAFPGITHYGKHGPDTSAVSHEYALAQALAHCDIVAAVLPQTTLQVIEQNPNFHARLRGVFALPSDTFKAENVQSVKTDLLIFGPKLNGPAAKAPEFIRIKRGSIDTDSQPPQLFQLSCRSVGGLGLSRHPIRNIGIEPSKPVITTPVTGNKTVILDRAGRWIKLKFADGATEARVMNRLYQTRLFSDHTHKYPKETRYSGQFKLNLDVIALQAYPFKALSEVCSIIRDADGCPMVTAQLTNGVKAVIAENRKMAIPYGRTVYRKGTPSFHATAKKMGLINRQQRGAAVKAGETVKATRIKSGGYSGFQVETGKGVFDCEHDAFFSLFTPENAALDAGYWEEIYPPIADLFRLKLTA